LPFPEPLDWVPIFLPSTTALPVKPDDELDVSPQLLSRFIGLSLIRTVPHPAIRTDRRTGSIRSAIVATMSQEIPAAVQRALTAIDEQDNDAFVAAFAPDGYVNDWGREFRGPDQIRSWSQNELIGKQATFTDTQVTVAGNPLTILTQVGGQGFNGPSHFTFAIKNDQLASMTITA
jgi:hypothetical protein